MISSKMTTAEANVAMTVANKGYVSEVRYNLVQPSTTNMRCQMYLPITDSVEEVLC
jgi:hypothetical protein